MKNCASPIRRVAGTVRLPGSKSISNRVLLLRRARQGQDAGAAACWMPTTRA
jgi:5-enolpyruvylshikimate-3-phosphate synthase